MVDVKALVLRGVEECVTDDELEELIKNNRKPKAYVGFEPSGLLHAGSLVPMLKVRELIEAGDLPGLINVTRNSLEKLAARDALDNKRKEKPATSPDDLRSRLDGVTNPADVAVALDATDLESALDG